MPSENGWEPSRVGPDACEWITVPGTTDPPVRLQVMKGIPLPIMRAYAADYHAFVEPLRDPDSASWTPTNSVATSNHLNGTAMDLNWESHAFRVSYAGYTPQMIATMRELIDFYEGTMFWAQDWDDPKDAMHHQMGYRTYQDQAKCRDFIARKIRADGYSTFRRGNTPMANDPALVLSKATGLSLGRATEILPAVRDGLAAAECVNVNRIAMWLAQIGLESDSFNATEEYASGDESTDRWLYKGRTWIQITWRTNYAGFGAWAAQRGLVTYADYFVDNPRALADLKWAGLGPAWYWTVARPQINALCDAGDLIGVTKAINGGLNGLEDHNGQPGRRTRYQRALALGDQLLTLTTGDDDFMAALSADEQREMLSLLRVLAKDLYPSRSPLRHLGEKEIDTIAGIGLNEDGNVHVLSVIQLARVGDYKAIALLREIATADPAKYPDRQADAQLAQRILADLETSNPAALQAFLNGASN